MQSLIIHTTINVSNEIAIVIKFKLIPIAIHCAHSSNMAMQLYVLVLLKLKLKHIL